MVSNKDLHSKRPDDRFIISAAGLNLSGNSIYIGEGAA